MTPDIIFIPTLSGGYYVDRSKATIVARGGYGRLEFELSEHEIAQLEEGELEVWGDEADLVFSNVQPDWVSWVKGLWNVKSSPVASYSNLEESTELPCEQPPRRSQTLSVNDQDAVRRDWGCGARFEDRHAGEEFNYWVRVDENNVVVERW
jgi:hypothetical protein